MISKHVPRAIRLARYTIPQTPTNYLYRSPTHAASSLTCSTLHDSAVDGALPNTYLLYLQVASAASSLTMLMQTEAEANEARPEISRRRASSKAGF